MIHQHNKAKVWSYWELLDTHPSDLIDAVGTYCHENVVFNGPHPINDHADPKGIAEGYLSPLFSSFPDLKREPYIFMGGHSYDETTWVSSTGNLVGTFAENWLGIPATGQQTSIRYGEFCKLWDGKIGEIYLILDIPAFCHQQGIDLLPPGRGSSDPIPGPKGIDGVQREVQSNVERFQTRELVDRMLFGLSKYDQVDKESMGQAEYWKEDMRWYGPGGIGTTEGLTSFEEDHQLPWLKAFPDRKGGHHKARFSEGFFACCAGWPSMYATHVDSFLGMPPTNQRVTFRVMDWWVRSGNKLAENWVFVDLLDLANQMGIDLIESALVK